MRTAADDQVAAAAENNDYSLGHAHLRPLQWVRNVVVLSLLATPAALLAFLLLVGARGVVEADHAVRPHSWLVGAVTTQHCWAVHL